MKSTASWCNCRCRRRWIRRKILLAVDPAKDVDGFHPMNVGYLSTQRPGLVPCTPAGIMEMLKRSRIPDRRAGSRRRRPQRHRGQADGDAAAQRQCDGDGVPFEDARPACRLPPRRHSGRRHRPRRNDHARLRQPGRHRDRRGNEPRDRSRRIRRRCSQATPSAKKHSARKVQPWSAMSIRKSQKLPEPSRPCPAASAR